MAFSETLFISQDTSIAEAIRVIDKSGFRIALIVSEQKKLQGVITDYDIRKALLQNADMSAPITPYINRNPVVAPDSLSKQDLKELMSRMRKDQIPLVDSEGRVVGLETIFTIADSQPSFEHTAVIMAGGKGSRLQPLTSDVPKPLLSINNKPLLDIVLEELQRQSIRKIFISINYLGHKIRESIGDGKKIGVEIEYVQEKEPLGTAGALSLLPSKPGAPFIVMNGDLLTKVNFGSLLSYHAQTGNLMTVCVRKHTAEVPYGVVDIEDSRVTGVHEKPSYAFFVNAGIYVLEPKVLEYIPSDRRFDMTELISVLIRENAQVGSFPVYEYWLDIGREMDYKRAHEEYERHFSKV